MTPLSKIIEEWYRDKAGRSGMADISKPTLERWAGLALKLERDAASEHERAERLLEKLEELDGDWQEDFNDLHTFAGILLRERDEARQIAGQLLRLLRAWRAMGAAYFYPDSAVVRYNNALAALSPDLRELVES